MLIETITRQSETPRRTTVTWYQLKCDQCHTEFERRAGNCRIDALTHFCKNKCRGTYRREHLELWIRSIETMNSPVIKKKAADSIKKKAAAGEWTHMRGNRHSEETKKHLSEVRISRELGVGEKNGMFGRNHTEESRAKMSATRTQLMVEGRFCPPFTKRNKKGFYTSLKSGKTWCFRSSWEEALMNHLDKNDCVTSWEYEPVRIPYMYNDHKRWYVPDFRVCYDDGSTRILEVKPAEFTGEAKIMAKAAAAEVWCKENSSTYLIVTKQVLHEWQIVV